MAIIIIEGCDKTGKSTLIKLLSEQTDIDVVKCSAPIGDPYTEYVQKLVNAKSNTVFDRFCYGELVYGPIYRDGSQLTPEQLKNLERCLSYLEAIIVHTTGPVERTKKLFDIDKEESTNKDDIVKIEYSFGQVFSKSMLSVFQYNFEDDNTKLIKQLVNQTKLKLNSYNKLSEYAAKLFTS